MSFIIALYEKNRKEAKELVDNRVADWIRSETKDSYENMDRWAGNKRMGENETFSLDIYSMLFVTTFHPEYVEDLWNKKRDIDEIKKKIKNPKYKIEPEEVPASFKELREENKKERIEEENKKREKEKAKRRGRNYIAQDPAESEDERRQLMQ